MAQVVEALVGQLVDEWHVGLGRVAVRVLVAALVPAAVVGLGVLLLPGEYLLFVDAEVVALHP